MWLCSSTVVSMTEWQKSVHNGVKLFFLYSFVSDFDIYIDIWGHFRAQQKTPGTVVPEAAKNSLQHVAKGSLLI